MNQEKGLAYCGLGCCVCKVECVGCRNGGCEQRDWCGVQICCREKNLAGCWECASFPCDEGMFQKIRVRTFVELIQEIGEEKLIRHLCQNEEKGIQYHHEGKITGDYDACSTRDEIIRLITTGNVD